MAGGCEDDGVAEAMDLSTVLAAAMVFKSTWWPGGAAEPFQLPGGAGGSGGDGTRGARCTLG